ncbi:MAG: exodeoxyribonuclease VII small subunit [Reichenbachiella sp.]
MSKKQPKSYQESFDELSSISQQLESEEVSIDNLTTLVERSNLLLKFCQDKLRKTEEEINKSTN